MDFYGNSVAAGRLVCPKPRRARQSIDYSNNSIRFHLRNDGDVFDPKPGHGADVFDLIIRKVDFEADQCGAVPSSPPFLFGSPPCRASNPVAQDAHFGVQNPTYTCSSPADSASLISAHARSKFTMKQAAPRVEGFDCGGPRVTME